MTYYLGIDIGGTNLNVGMIAADGQCLASDHQPLKGDKSADAVIAQLADMVRILQSQLKGNLIAAGCGIPGIVDASTGIVFKSPNFPKWCNEPMQEKLATALSIPVVLDNDANMFARGEQIFGAARGCNNMLFLTIGTGIGGGLILNGNIFHGDKGFAGEVGHVTVYPEGVPCECGNRGCWEQYAASRGFMHLVDKKNNDVKQRILLSLGVDSTDLITPKYLGDMAKNGNSDALELWKELGEHLGIGIANLVNILGVYRIVIGGGITMAWDYFIDTTLTCIALRTYKENMNYLTLEKAMLGDNTGILGAAAEAMHVYLKPRFCKRLAKRI